MAKEILTEDKAEQTPTGGVLVGKRRGQTMIHNKGSLSGYLVGRTHAEGGIKAVNTATGQPLEMQGGEVVITAPAVSDQTKRKFEGKMMTNREILSEINTKGGGLSFANGGDIPEKLKYTGASYNFGGKVMSDHDIYMHINGGHLAKGKTLKQIAKMHDVELFDIEKQVKMGMKVESEHTSSKREQLKIVKDHLVENPKYYTLLKKAGLKKGGLVKKEDLAKNSDKGDTPARDLNNYNDVMDLEADGAVGGDNGLAFAKGGIIVTSVNDIPNFEQRLNERKISYRGLGTGKLADDFYELAKMNGTRIKVDGKEYYITEKEFDSFSRDSNGKLRVRFEAPQRKYNGGALAELDKHFDLGGDISMPAVQLIKIKRVDNGLYFDLKGKEFSSFIVFSNFVKDLFLYNNKAYVAIIFTVNDDAKEMGILCKNAKNTVLNFNPVTGTVKDFEKQIQRRYPRSAKNFYWENWLESKVLPKASSVAQTNTNQSNLVQAIKINYADPTTKNDTFIFTASVEEFLKYLILMKSAGVGNVMFELSVNGFVVKGTTYGLSITDDSQDTWVLPNQTKINPTIATQEDVLEKLQVEYPDYDFSKFAGGLPLKTTAQSTVNQAQKITDLSNTKIWIGDNPELATAIQLKAFELGYEWAIRGQRVRQDNNLKFLYFRGGSKTIEGRTSDTRIEFDENPYKEIFASDLLDYVPTSSASASTSSNAVDPVFATEVPDSIPNFSKKGIDLPPAVLILAFKRAYEQGVEPKDVDLNRNVWGLGFSFPDTAEGFGFWDDVSNGNFINFKEKYGKYGEKLKDLVLGLTNPKITDLSETKIWIGDNPELSRAVQEKAFELGWKWFAGSPTEVRYTDDSQYLSFSTDKNIFRGSFKDDFNDLSKKEIFASDLLDSVPTSSAQQSSNQTAVPLTPEQELAKKYVADDFQLRKNDLIGSVTRLEEARKDLVALSLLLPSFQASKFAVEKASILKEMAKLNKKITYEGFIRSNEEASKGDDLFTPQGLLDYYYTQTTQNPTAELEPACELPTPNGAKSKLPMGAYLNVRTSQFKKWFGDWEKAYETGNYVNCSKMIDEETKEPKIYFHGVRKYVPNFGQMSNMGKGVVRPYGSFEPPTFPASYFADNESYAKFYGGIAENLPTPSPDYKPFIYKVFLSVKNPISLLPLDFELSYKDLMDYVFVAYGIRLQVNNALLAQLDNDINKLHPIWVYIRRDIGLIETLKDYGYDALFQTGDIPVFDKNGEVVSDRSKFIKDTEYLTFYPNQVKSATVKKSFYFDFFNDIRFKKGGYVRI